LPIRHATQKSHASAAGSIDLAPALDSILRMNLTCVPYRSLIDK
jgi:hypothetical protein